MCWSEWCWSTPLPQGNTVRTMWSAPGAGIWAGGDGGSVLRHDGQEWQGIDLPGRNNPVIWGSGPDDVYVAIGGSLWRYAGSTFGSVALPATLSGAVFRDLSGTAADDVWAATSLGPAHFDGSAWALVAGVPQGFGNSVAAVATNDVWLGGINPAGNDAQLFHWDGMSWTLVAGAAPNALFGAGPGEIWFSALGSVYRGGLSGFSAVMDAPGADSGRSLFGTGPNDVYVMTTSGSAQHFDGQDWVSAGFGDQTVYGGRGSTGTAAAPGQAWMGGYYGRLWEIAGSGLVAQAPNISDAGRRQLRAVHSDGTNVYAVGNGLVKLDASGETDAWVVVENVLGLNDIWGASPDEMWVVGESDRILRFDGVATVLPTRAAATNTQHTWNAVHGSSASDVWAVGSRGLTHYDGVSWSDVTSIAAGGVFLSVWVAPDGQAFVGGEAGVAGHYTPGSGWSTISELDFSLVDWNAVGGSSSSDVWFMESDNVVYHYDGVEWSKVTVPGQAAGNDMNDLFAIAPNDVWAVGQFGRVLHYDGSVWNRVEIKCDAVLEGLWMAPSGEGWTVGTTPLPSVALHRLPR
jgi:hypothetical protein